MELDGTSTRTAAEVGDQRAYLLAGPSLTTVSDRLAQESLHKDVQEVVKYFTRQYGAAAFLAVAYRGVDNAIRTTEQVHHI